MPTDPLPPLKKRKSLSANHRATQPRPPRRYPRLLYTNSNGNITANPLVLPSNIPSPVPFVISPLESWPNSASDPQTPLPLNSGARTNPNKLRARSWNAVTASETAAKSIGLTSTSTASKPLCHEIPIDLEHSRQGTCPASIANEVASEGQRSRTQPNMSADDARVGNDCLVASPKNSNNVQRKNGSGDGLKEGKQIARVKPSKFVGEGLNSQRTNGTVRYGLPSIPEDMEETLRVLQMTKEYEVRKLEAFSEVTYHVMIKTDQRKKIGEWMQSSSGVVANAILFIVLALNMSTDLVTGSSEKQWRALHGMDNGNIRILEALMMRTKTDDGLRNWALLTAKFDSSG